MLHHSGRFSREKADLVSLSFSSGSGTEGSTEDIFVFLLWEVYIIVSVRMAISSWVISIILPGWLGSEVLWKTIGPVFDIEIWDWFTLIIVTDGHSSLVGLVVNGLSSEVPLSLFSKTFKNVIWADLHNGNLFVKASFFTSSSSTSLVLSDFSVATSWNLIWLESHEFRLFHVWVTETSILMTESLSFSIWVPVIMGLVMSMILVEGVIQVTIDPGELRNMAEEKWHLSIFSWGIVVSLSKRV